MKTLKPVKIYTFTLIVFSVCLFLIGCDWLRTFTLGEYIQIVHKSPRLTLAWDPPLTDSPNRPTEVASYVIYYREHGTIGWQLLDEIPANENPQYTVDHKQLGDGLYDFAIRAIAVGGDSSPLHSSLDSSADPISGWYVFWVKSD